ncbi:NADP-dependent oxidoreductase [Sneathiella chinensis]|uniref:NADP-dependent oxidoreductase n=1 Tax=Sneathiella chinensis TaxID=349750 RepID=A0ABQ5U4B3_9PROT|nr:NADP-dependent oxidoreductase [Sneathiella chinensis]GLQ06683.1 NADP-dependent oxidoreductase [Sneathiella chinensis]
MTEMNKQWLLKSRPVGEPTPDNFELAESPVSEPAEGQFLVKVIYMSLDPYMRGRMNASKSYAVSAELGQPMTGSGVGVVVKSRHKGFAEGDYVMGMTNWQSYWLSDGTGVMKLDPARAPISTAVGVLGMPGLTAYVGLLDIGQPKEGETVVVAAASGAVGSVVGQVAKIKGARAVGIAGSKEKCDFVEKELGFDICLNYKDPDFVAKLHEACPKGIDVYFENVGGAVFEAVFPLMNDFARIPLCGRIANYNMTADPEGPNKLPAFFGDMLVKRMTLQGFIISDRYNRLPDFLRDMGAWVAAGEVKYKEDIVKGIEKAPEAFIGLLKGANFGKLLVQVSDDPTRK